MTRMAELDPDPESLEPSNWRLVTSTSISSKNTIAGSAALASRNTWRTAASASPKNGENTFAAESVRNVAPLECAAARTIVLLLQPGGP